MAGEVDIEGRVQLTWSVERWGPSTLSVRPDHHGAFVERVIGSNRHECHVVAFNERNLLRVLAWYFDYHEQTAVCRFDGIGTGSTEEEGQLLLVIGSLVKTRARLEADNLILRR